LPFASRASFDVAAGVMVSARHDSAIRAGLFRANSIPTVGNAGQYQSVLILNASIAAAGDNTAFYFLIAVFADHSLFLSKNTCSSIPISIPIPL